MRLSKICFFPLNVLKSKTINSGKVVPDDIKQNFDGDINRRGHEVSCRG